eukprot:scaffold1470_cov118-Isochrysis_galbana.AAC.1
MPGRATHLGVSSGVASDRPSSSRSSASSSCLPRTPGEAALALPASSRMACFNILAALQSSRIGLSCPGRVDGRVSPVRTAPASSHEHRAYALLKRDRVDHMHRAYPLLQRDRVHWLHQAYPLLQRDRVHRLCTRAPVVERTARHVEGDLVVAVHARKIVERHLRVAQVLPILRVRGHLIGPGFGTLVATLGLAAAAAVISPCGNWVARLQRAVLLDTMIPVPHAVPRSLRKLRGDYVPARPERLDSFEYELIFLRCPGDSTIESIGVGRAPHRAGHWFCRPGPALVGTQGYGKRAAEVERGDERRHVGGGRGGGELIRIHVSEARVCIQRGSGWPAAQPAAGKRRPRSTKRRAARGACSPANSATLCCATAQYEDAVTVSIIRSCVGGRRWDRI